MTILPMKATVKMPKTREKRMMWMGLRMKIPNKMNSELKVLFSHSMINIFTVENTTCEMVETDMELLRTSSLSHHTYISTYGKSISLSIFFSL